MPLARAAALLAALSTCAPAIAASRPHRPGTFCTPVFVEGVGTVRICGVPNRARR